MTVPVPRKAFVEARLSARGSKIRHLVLKQFGLSFISDHFSDWVCGVGMVGSKKGVEGVGISLSLCTNFLQGGSEVD